eukprot:CAMPEP_0184713618 /NCGR_PEP_ID=MMETSP0314-20130426/3941_1 /TAXON_ID=38298 /ORGANISM="Rhodella maculata, Strain CCMP 736" /LENGTH=37 /DNA_ID= /DNA_START= /DNA_END= /DNA_ORIENTATION=
MSVVSSTIVLAMVCGTVYEVAWWARNGKPGGAAPTLT